MGSEPKPEGGEIVRVMVKEIARLIGVEAGRIQIETPLNRIKGLVPKVDTIPQNSKKARLYLLTIAGWSITGPRARALEDLGRYVTVPVAVRRAHEDGRVREGDSLVYVPGEEEGERVYHFRVSQELVEVGERSDPGEREVAVKAEASKEADGDRPDDLRAVGTDVGPSPSPPSTPRRVRRRSSGPREA